MIDRVLEHADGWIPLAEDINDTKSFADRVTDLRQRSAATGRTRPSVTVYGATQTAEALEAALIPR